MLGDGVNVASRIHALALRAESAFPGAFTRNSRYFLFSRISAIFSGFGTRAVPREKSPSITLGEYSPGRSLRSLNAAESSSSSSSKRLAPVRKDAEATLRPALRRCVLLALSMAYAW